MARFDAAIARLYVTQYQGGQSNPRKVEHLMPWPRPDSVEEQPMATPQQILALLTASVKKKPH